MDLKDFIKQTIGGIIDATNELQATYEDEGIFVNPPVTFKERDLFEENSPGGRFRRVETIEFDVAVSASSDSTGGGKASLKILSVEAGINGEHRRLSEEVSRVRFSIPLTLPKSSAEDANREALEKHHEDVRKANEARKNKRKWIE